MCEEILVIKNLNYSYPSGEGEVLSDVNLTIKNGQSACIVGPNGGGKSTLLKLILGILRPKSGTIELFGDSPENTRYFVGYMPQYHLMDFSFPITAGEVVMQGRQYNWGKIRYNAKDRQIVHDVMAEMNIEALADLPFASLSGGQRQRILIARALAQQPKFLLLDEPTANIDPGAGEQFYALLEDLRKQMTVVTVSHDLGFVNRETDLVICVNRQVAVHQADKFDSAAADAVYKHQMKLIHHSHSCFCGCEGESISGVKK